MTQYQPDEPFRGEHEAGGESAGLARCARHPAIETGLACGRCSTYICPRCMIPTPVGARCPDCARVTTLPTYDVQPSYAGKAMLAGLISGVVVGFIWWFVLDNLAVPFLPWLLSFAAGYVIGEAVSRSTNRKRGQTLALIAGAGTAAAIIVVIVMSSPNSVGDWLFLLIFGGLAGYVAVNRVR